jgi:hypothetical protein
VEAGELIVEERDATPDEAFELGWVDGYTHVVHSVQAKLDQLISDLDKGRADGTIYTYGQVQERLLQVVREL